MTFFTFFWTSIVKNRIIRLSKGLFREIYSIKEFILNHVLSIKALVLRLNYSRQGKKFVYSRKLEIDKKHMRQNIKGSFYPLIIPKLVKTPEQSLFFLHLKKMSSKSCMIRFGIRFSEIGFEKFINYGQSSQS